MKVKSCRTCDRRELGKCNYSGCNCTTERMYPTKCGSDYQYGWVQRRTFWQRLMGINKDEK